MFPPTVLEILVQHATVDAVSALARTCKRHMLIAYFFAKKHINWSETRPLDADEELVSFMSHTKPRYVVNQSFLYHQVSKILLYSLNRFNGTGMPITPAEYLSNVALHDCDEKWLDHVPLTTHSSSMGFHRLFAKLWMKRDEDVMNLFAIQTSNLELYDRTEHSKYSFLGHKVTAAVENIKSIKDVTAIELFLKVAQMDIHDTYDKVVESFENYGGSDGFHPVEVPCIFRLYENNYELLGGVMSKFHGLYERLKCSNLIDDDRAQECLLSDWRSYHYEIISAPVWETPFLAYCATEFIHSERFLSGRDMEPEDYRKLELLSGLRFPDRVRKRLKIDLT